MATNVAANSKTYLGLHVKCPIIFTDFNQIRIFFWMIFMVVPNIKFHGHPSSGSHADRQIWRS